LERGSHGTITSTITVASFGVRVVEHAANVRLQRHRHDAAKIVFVLQGGYRESMRGADVLCEPGTLFFKPAGEPHTNVYGARPSRSLIIDAPASLDDRLRPAQQLFDRFRVSRDGASNRLAARIADELKQPDDAAQLAIEGLLLELLAAALRREPAFDDRLGDARDYMRAHWATRITLAEVANACNLTPTRLARTFRRAYGLTPGEFQRRLRAEWAADEMQRSDRPIAEIALAAGFADQSHLNRVFKRVFGETPAAYRNRTNVG
jgi:AraC family transcriptional regulator